MDELVRSLKQESRVLDLGSGGGSFDYRSTSAGVVGMDLDFPGPGPSGLGRVIGDARHLPLKDGSFDVVVCNHTLEHFVDAAKSITEIGRVLKSGGSLWVSIPDADCLDDRIYRFLFIGGGHVNRFSLQSLIELVRTSSSLQPVRYKKLYSGFVYLNPPPPQKLAYFPPRARWLSRIPAAVLESFIRWFNYWARLWDRILGTRVSQYGWGVVFRQSEVESPEPGPPAEMPGDANVCFSCGAGHPEATLLDRSRRFGFWKVYSCPSCGKKNLFFKS